MIGPRGGLAVGARVGIAVGISADPVGASGGPSMAGVAQDATSGKYLPATAGQWTQTLTVAGIGSSGPSAIHLLQDPSGNPADVLGTFPLTASGTLAYLQAVTGWAAKGIKTSSGVAGIMQTVSASLPDISTTSMLALVYVLLPGAAATTRSYVTFGPGFGFQAACNYTSGTQKAVCLDGANTATGVDDPTSTVRPLLLQIDRTHNVVELCTNLERITPTFATGPTGKAYILGGDNGQTNFPDTAIFLYSALFVGSAAELTVSNKRSLLQTLGWSIPW